MRSVKELLRLWVKSYCITVHSSESSQNVFLAQLNIELNINIYLVHMYTEIYADYAYIFFIYSTVLASFIIQFLLFKH